MQRGAALIWHQVKEHENLLQQTIAAKKLDGVHHLAFAIRDLVNALSTESKLDAEKTAKLERNARFISALATRLDETGDANDQAGTGANFKKLRHILNTIEALYPSGQLTKEMKSTGM